MNLDGQRTINATVEQTWAGLNDPQVLQQCITGCESIVADGADRFKVLLALKVGPVSARFAGQLLLEDIVPLVSYKILFEGQGGTAGFGKGEAKVSLQNVNGITRLTYTSQAHVGGRLAQVGSRLIDSVAAKVAEDFFNSFERQMQNQYAAENSIALLGQHKPAAHSQAKAWRVSWGLILLVVAMAAWYLFA